MEEDGQNQKLLQMTETFLSQDGKAESWDPMSEQPPGRDGGCHYLCAILLLLLL